MKSPRATHHGYQTDDSGDFPFQHVGARYYDPGSGRFLQRDPIGIKGSMNVYEYVRSSPGRRIDPNGLSPLSDDLKDVGAIIIGVVGIIVGVVVPTKITVPIAIGSGAVVLGCAMSIEERHPDWHPLDDYMDYHHPPPSPPKRPKEKPWFCGVCKQSGRPHAHMQAAPGY